MSLHELIGNEPQEAVELRKTRHREHVCAQNAGRVSMHTHM